MADHGFDLLREETIAEYRASARLYRHRRTGAELISISAEDENKVFGITFRTPPRDHTGVAHILEHSVLCGSRRYRVKEPFVELLKGSLHTFLNAFTYPDKTCYPVASANLKDFYNLIEVYLDAVFYPLLSRATFEQEGWHFELESPEQPLRFKGVVYNEMKGVYSSPDSVLMEVSQQSLFPDTVYRFDSGGNPAYIPDLTYEQLVDFHRTYYHPSNSLIWFYGDDDPEKRLRVMNSWLSAFKAAEVDSRIPDQPPFQEPRRVERGYRVSEEAGGKAFVTCNWLWAAPWEPGLQVRAQTLAHILIGSPSSPLRRALLESGLGEELAGCGLETHARRMFFSTGLRGVAPERVEEVPALATRVLQELAEKGIDRKTVDASLNTVEFALRENNTGRMPRGLALMLRSLSSWLYGGDPFVPLRFSGELESLRSRHENGERVFEPLIREWLLENSHRTTVILRPDPTLGDQLDRAEQERLAAARRAMNEEDLRRLAAHTAELIALQRAPDDPEALAKIPRLSLRDLPKDNRITPSEKRILAQTRVYVHDLFTNGIVYVDLGLDARALEPEFLPYVPLLGRAFLETGTAQVDYVALNQRIGARTGGIVPEIYCGTVRETRQGVCRLFLRGKALERQIGDLFDIFREILLSARIDLQSRVRQIALEDKARLEADLLPHGHRFVALRARAPLTEGDFAAERTGGLSYLLFLRKAVRDMESDWSRAAIPLATAMDKLVNRRTMVLGITTDRETYARIEPLVGAFLEELPARAERCPAWDTAEAVSVEGLTVPASVNYVAKAIDLYAGGHSFAGGDLVAAHLLRGGYLWDKIRVQGGAYGAFCQFDYRSGILTMMSYRDPNTVSTLETFDGAAEWLEQLALERAEVEKAIIGAIGDFDRYQLPDARGFDALKRRLTNDSDDFRRLTRRQMLEADVEALRRFGSAIRARRATGRVAILGAPEAVEQLAPERVTRIL